ncbi:hypothetical protein HMPREF0201_01088 [Cedecea davisae DSM 4568]|uniref:Uncharacterized protein n=1 Tax=Cedecea davisae DSM 4568 TaxID=566551 RepID=S3JE58_9ENTR|nr:hypothetical protein HMPREF0201_01088 [Cedecea davisae DSM 4568]
MFDMVGRPGVAFFYVFSLASSGPLSIFRVFILFYSETIIVSIRDIYSL